MKNEYLCREADRRVDPLVQVCLKFGKTGKAPVSMIKNFAAAEEMLENGKKKRKESAVESEESESKISSKRKKKASSMVEQET